MGITLDINNLDEVCDYVHKSELYFLVFFISPANATRYLRYNYYPNLWIVKAKEKYGDKFLGAYVMDEPGGNQLDHGNFQLVLEAKDYAEAAEMWLELLEIHIDHYTYLRKYEDYIVLTADYGLYWFDYKGGYDTVLVEFAWNHSRPLHLGLCRGAANVQNRDWGMIVTWTYEGPPYLLSGPEIYEDMILAYHNGAKYVVIFDYPATDYSEYGTLTEEHFEALEDFWNYVNDNPNKHGMEKAEVAYVLPENFGFGFRSSHDTIWGLWSADTDERTEKIWSDVNQLIDEYGTSLDIVYSDPEFNDDLHRYYEKVIFWNETLN